MLIFTFGPFSKGKHVTILNCRAVLNLNLAMNLMKLNKLSRPDSIVALDIELITTRRYSKKSVVDLFTREERSGESFDA